MRVTGMKNKGDTRGIELGPIAFKLSLQRSRKLTLNGRHVHTRLLKHSAVSHDSGSATTASRALPQVFSKRGLSIQRF